MSTIAVDVGGTHTDLYGWLSDEKRVVQEKVPTTTDDPTAGVMNALQVAGVDLTSVDTFMHGSTIATNAVIEGEYSATPFITTEGFRDLIEIGRYHREELYNPYQSKPEPLTPRRHRFTVTERVNEEGEVTESLDEQAVYELAERFRQNEVQSVAVGFINSYSNPEHEQRVQEIIEETVDDTYVAISSEISGKLGSVPRFNSTIMNAALEPVMSGYLDKLNRKIKDEGFSGSFYVIRSDGGVAGTEKAKRQAETTILSGPAAGVKGSQAIGEAVGESNVIGMDMGGTSTDVSLIEDGEPLVTTEYEVKFDIPLVKPMLDVTTIGSGGGSIAWIDEGGSLRVGPQSAGAEPGPVCYGMGGTEPTITDAHLVLGRLDPETVLGGKRSLDRDAAHNAIKRLADRLDMNALEAAEGILKIANENTAAAVRETTIERGQDPREYYLIGFGGAGPMHAAEVAESLDVSSVVVPSASGVLSAVGGTMMNIQHNNDKTFYKPVKATTPSELETEFQELERDIHAIFEEEGIASADVELERIAEMRYVGQTYEVDVPVSDESLDEGTIDRLSSEFHRRHEQEYGIASDQFPVTFANLRVVGSQSTATQEFQGPSSTETDSADGGTREVYFDGEWQETSIYLREGLDPGTEFEGPAIVEGDHSTITINPTMSASIDEHENVIIDTQN
ncbi:hydantoinase/oxoprolinase family protein [Natrinema versiforme]|uniref:Hydantoinase/oxoprolinase family protein n=1 Tax=Natrinema versiforme TaxID=88724 RepID=A0A4P8WM98_9EURY|nr:hydantoinase/oxoprolinase family protein [Natrinema versiforme]QCS44707.1 hydantoinase/oxoprolinase family protein [Natrinema versiforme]